MPPVVMTIWRALAGLFLIWLVGASFKPINLAQFTHWGIYLTIIYCILQTVHDLRLRVLGSKETYRGHPWIEDRSPLCLWKWCVFFFEAAFIFENLIVLFYWSVLYWGIDFTTKTQFEIACNYIDHIVPLAVLLVDMFCNRIPFNRRHLTLLVPLILVYGIDNIVVSLVRGIPIYKPIDPKKPLAYLIALPLPLLDAGLFLLWEVFVRWKIAAFDRLEAR